MYKDVYGLSTGSAHWLLNPVPFGWESNHLFQKHDQHQASTQVLFHSLRRPSSFISLFSLGSVINLKRFPNGTSAACPLCFFTAMLTLLLARSNCEKQHGMGFDSKMHPGEVIGQSAKWQAKHHGQCCALTSERETMC